MDQEDKDVKPVCQIQLPPGFRFHPSDEELILHYLRKKATNHPLPAAIFADVELYKFNPWDLPMKASFGDEEWYFFSPRDRKYPNGMRPNRMASSGYWKATGTDKPILSSSDSKVIGVKKALVFYVGRPPKGNKTDWIMHEYRLPEEATWKHRKEKTMRLDEWVVCRVRHKITGMRGQFLEDRKGPRNKEAAQAYYKRLEKQCSTGFMGSKVAPLRPFLLGFHQNPCMDIAAGSDISFEGSKTTSSSVCEDNFINIDYTMSNWQNPVPHFSLDTMRKRETTDDNSEEDVLSFRNMNKKARHLKESTKEMEIAQHSATNDNTSVSPLDELGSATGVSMPPMHQDVYGWDIANVMGMAPRWFEDEMKQQYHSSP